RKHRSTTFFTLFFPVHCCRVATSKTQHLCGFAQALGRSCLLFHIGECAEIWSQFLQPFDGGTCMKKLVVAAAASITIAGAAHAPDMSLPVKPVAPPPPPPPLFDIAFGVTGTSDYLFRGISQTNNNPAIQGFVELQAFDWLYFNVWASNQNWVENFQVEGN